MVQVLCVYPVYYSNGHTPQLRLIYTGLLSHEHINLGIPT